ncbi:class I SAM-dependent methyltransferase [Thermostaphylospora chromogena]|uniref:Methyltransferase domain-containing protein n=1 Tax=Thermostaphylospora chromogena TaxID=35622 RepID=A0A1H1E988_9ACTN|nr:class I SAM-dependent methyltransferase [Thermostaphylospora chromogena]SDQ85263.1 Methyltransferase domain-containing protein [Thermostaphylospora chromogena]
MTAPSASPWTPDAVPGWFPETDMRLFEWLLGWQERTNVHGDLLELGAYLGRSAILIGRHRRAEERFTVCDLFEPLPAREDARDHPELSRAAFETNYLAFHPTLPEIVQGPSASIRDHVKPGSCRFVHIDASKVYEHVRADLEAARELVVPEGIVVVEGYRAEETPGVARAVWDAVATGGLRPVCLTPARFYGTWGDSAPIVERLADWLAERPDEWAYDRHLMDGRAFVRARLTTTTQRPTLPLPTASRSTPVAPAWTARKAPRKRRYFRRLVKMVTARPRRSLRAAVRRARRAWTWR